MYCLRIFHYLNNEGENTLDLSYLRWFTHDNLGKRTPRCLVVVVLVVVESYKKFILYMTAEKCLKKAEFKPWKIDARKVDC